MKMPRNSKNSTL